MTQDQYVIRRKLNILELGETLGNISEACRRFNISRQKTKIYGYFLNLYRYCRSC